MSCTTFFYAFI